MIADFASGIRILKGLILALAIDGVPLCYEGYQVAFICTLRRGP